MYAACFAFLGQRLRFRYGYPEAGGLLVTCAVWMVPLMAYALEAWTGIWPASPSPASLIWRPWRNELAWIPLELVTAVVGILALRWVRYPFLTCPVAFAPPVRPAKSYHAESALPGARMPAPAARRIRISKNARPRRR